MAAELAATEDSQRQVHEGATHEEARPENSKDTRALEQTYLARGLAGRVAQLEAALATLASMAVRRFDEETPISISSVVVLEDDDGDEARYYIAPVGGGTSLADGEHAVTVVTPASPMGRALVGKHEGDDAEIRGPKGTRELAIVSVS